MNTIANALFNWLVYSSLVLLLVITLLLISRKFLIARNYARTTVLQLWLAIPLSLLACFLAMNLMIQEIYLEPFVITVPVQVEILSQVTAQFEWRSYLVLLWFIVVSLRVQNLVVQYLKAKKTILKHSTRISKNLYHSDLDISPMAFGVFKPVIILPTYLQLEFNPNEIGLVTLHEKIHCQRFDPFWRFTFEILRCMYWFLPLYRMTKLALIEDQEMSCDEQVIKQSKEITHYAQLLLSLSTRIGPFTHSSLLCSASFNLKERIMKLNQTKNNNHQGIIIGLFLLCVFAVSSVSALPKLSASEVTESKITPVHTVSPKYPRSAYQEQLSGEVTLNFVVTTEGKVKDIQVVEAIPPGVFDKEAIRAMEQFIYEPVANEVKVQTSFKFNMD